MRKHGITAGSHSTKTHGTGKQLNLLTRAVAIRPDYAMAWNNRGIALEALGNAPDAVESYDRALDVNPG